MVDIVILWTFFDSACTRFGVHFHCGWNVTDRLCLPHQGINLSHWNYLEPINFSAISHRKHKHSSQHRRCVCTFEHTHSHTGTCANTSFTLNGEQDVAGFNERICNLISNFHAKLSLKFMPNAHLALYEWEFPFFLRPVLLVSSNVLHFQNDRNL